MLRIEIVIFVVLLILIYFRCFFVCNWSYSEIICLGRDLSRLKLFLLCFLNSLVLNWLSRLLLELPLHMWCIIIWSSKVLTLNHQIGVILCILFIIWHLLLNSIILMNMSCNLTFIIKITTCALVIRHHHKRVWSLILPCPCGLWWDRCRLLTCCFLRFSFFFHFVIAILDFLITLFHLLISLSQHLHLINMGHILLSQLQILRLQLLHLICLSINLLLQTLDILDLILIVHWLAVILRFDFIHLVVQALNFILVILYHFVLRMKLFLLFCQLVVFGLQVLFHLL